MPLFSLKKINIAKIAKTLEKQGVSSAYMPTRATFSVGWAQFFCAFLEKALTSLPARDIILKNIIILI